MYRMVFSIMAYCLVLPPAKAQVTTATILADLKAVNDSITATDCRKGVGPLVSNRAMNLFLANKIGYYLSGYDDLSFYKNNTTFNSGDGMFTLNHNLFQAKGGDRAVRSFLVVGARANVANAFAATFSNRSFSNELGATLKQTWLAKVKTSFAACHSDGSPATNAKMAMDARRAAILHSLEVAANERTIAFEKSIGAIQPSDVPGQALQDVRKKLREAFYADMQYEYGYQFALLQAEALDKYKVYKLISTNWTSISTYIPMMSRKFVVAGSLAGELAAKYAYPWAFTVRHTRFWESSQWGRCYLSLEGSLLLNSQGQSNTLQRLTRAEYISMGGTDPNINRIKGNEVLIGKFGHFLTPRTELQWVYFPPESHIGFSVAAEKHFGTYKVLNAVVGIPITLIDKKGIPAADFSFAYHFFDIGNKVSPQDQLDSRNFVSMAIGIPFSKIIF